MGIFRFQQFSVNDDQCGMKVGTDAILLGAWCKVGDAKRILDIGTGSGLIALMLAQKSSTSTHIDAIELQPVDALQARKNVDSSPWREKVSVITGSAQAHRPSQGYDLIVCNPPYFSRSLVPPRPDRKVVRHTETLPHDQLIDSAVRLMIPSAQFNVILPTIQSLAFQKESSARGLFLRRITRFFTRPGKPQSRSLMTFQLVKNTVQEDSLYLYGPDRIRTESYAKLTQDFYQEGKTV